MAKIAVISCNDRCCMGARQLSSLVKKNHAFYLICYGEYHHATFRETAVVGQKTDEELLLNLIGRLCPDLVGFSYRSIQFNLVAHLAGRIRSTLGIPVIMGGIGATSDPETALQHGDIVCIGEGDFVLPRLLDAIEETGSVDPAVRKTPNLWYRADGGIARNSMERLVSREELSDFPFIDYEAENKFSIVRGELIENDGRFDNDVGAYPMLTSRGCPFACTFCHNSTVHDLYRPQKYCRQRSVASVIAEMEQAKRRPEIRMFSVYDDLFNVNRRWAFEFAAEYGKRIAMPFWCYTHPLAVNREVHQALLNVGLDNTAMGVQSGSERVLYDLYNRRTSRRQILNAAAILKELKCRVQIDLITASPFEDDNDRRDTLDLMQSMPKITRKDNPVQPWYYCQSRLTFFPHSRISQMLEEKGMVPGFDPDLASFWEMLHELALMDDLPQSAVMYLSYLYQEYKQTAADFKPETGAHWIQTRLLSVPMHEIQEFVVAAGKGAAKDLVVCRIPVPEELTFSEVRVLMDGFQASLLDGDAGRNGKVAAALSVLREIVPKASAIRRLRSELHKNFPVTRQIEQRLRENPTLRRIFGRP